MRIVFYGSLFFKWGSTIKTLQIMNLIAILFLACCLQVNARTYSQSITLHVKNASLEQVFREIREQTGYTFMYTETMLKEARKVSMRVKNFPLQETLAICFASQPFTYTIIDRTVVMQPREGLVFNIIPGSMIATPPPVEIHGRVVNEQKEPIQDVSISVVGANIGTATDANGRFSLTLPDARNKILEISSVGFKTKRINVEGQTEISIVLELDITGLNDIVVIGYGSQAKKDLTGAVGSIGAAQIEDKAILNFNEAMVGQIAGVQVQQTSTSPGAGMSIKIRGTGSLGNAGNNNMPLYVVDGVPLDNDLSTRSAMGAASSSPDVPNDPLASLNPADIESINILKDASATSIYGARGSNGVVLITTKMGQRGKTVITANLSAGMQQVAHQIPMLNTAGWVERQIAIRNYNHVYLNGERRPGRDESDPNSARALGNKIPNEYKDPSLLHDINWQDEVYRNVPMTNYQLSASGGTGSMRFYISGNYINQEALNIGKGYKKYSLRGNIDADITNKIKVGFRIAPSYSINNVGASAGLTYYGGLNVALVTLPPIYPAYNPDGTFATRADMPLTYDDGTSPSILNFTNPAAMSALYKSQMKRFNTLGTFFTTVELARNLVFKTSISADVNNVVTDHHVPSTINIAGANRYATSFFSTNIGWTNENTVTYENTFNDKHRLNVLAGFTEQKGQFQSLSVRVNDLPNDLVETVNAGTLASRTASKTEWTMASLIGRVNYVFDDKYYVTATLRRDGSSKFGADSKWGTFPSAAIAWRVSQEGFMNSVQAISELKIRASYGLVGNDQIGRYAAIGAVAASNAILGTGDGQQLNGLMVTSLANPLLTWEQTKSFDIGLDLGLFNNRLNITADYYNKLSTDMLFNVPVPRHTGFGTIPRNMGAVRNTGVELSIESRNIVKKDFTWSTNFNISSNKNRVEALNDNNDPIQSINGGVVNSVTHLTEVGQPMSYYYGYIYDGVFKNWDEVNSSPLLGGGVLTIPGDPKLRDISGPNGRPDGIIDNYDRTNIGSNFPDFIYGLTNNFKYKNFDLSILVQGVQGFEALNLIKTSANYKHTSALFTGYWKSESQPGNGYDFRPGFALYQGNNPLITSWLVEDASFLRIKSLTLGYRFPKLFGGQVVKNARTYINIQNLFTFTNYKGFNPEVNSVEGSGSSGSITPGMDYGTYPMVRTFTLGLNVTL
ncbi:MAG TPA: TonB-dependent receptor [Flavitalea sp.]|nr:TonB-dependent receptor [Flavitalea sp.]